ncbi:MAG: hypothetical protein R3C49_21155 [Planctomycetaceae bacterium]
MPQKNRSFFGMQRSFSTLVLVAVILSAGSRENAKAQGTVDRSAAEATPTNIPPMLPRPTLTESLDVQQTMVKQQPDDQTEKFRLGIIQFLRALEGLGQDHHRYGLMSGQRLTVPLMRLPVPENKDPEELSYADARQMIVRFLERLNTAQQTLQHIDPADVRLPVDLATVGLDLNADGNLSDGESLLAISSAIQRGGRPPSQPLPTAFPVTFDGGDVPWLEGYCHVLSAFCEFALAHDWQDHFERSAVLFYPKAVTPYTWMHDETQDSVMTLNRISILDIVAFLHCINYECTEPERMKNSLQHLETMIACSRKSWELIEAETDNDREWLPNARQTSIMGSLQITQQIVTGWKDVLDEFEAILQGRKLLPFWRGVSGAPSSRPMQFHQKLGVNVRRIFLEPGRFDLALWMHGSGLQKYVEEGELTSPDDWRKFNRAFGGRFWNFAFWIN